VCAWWGAGAREKLARSGEVGGRGNRAGHDRWVEYAGNPKVFDVDPTAISARWHGWIHRVTDVPPTAVRGGRGGAERGAREGGGGSGARVQTTVGATPAGEKLVDASDAPFERNLGGVVSQYTPNQSQMRSRGYGTGNGIFDSAIALAPGEKDKFYTQPGSPLDPRNVHVRSARRTWSLLDTAETVRARHAAVASAAGLSGAVQAGMPMRPAGFEASLTAEEKDFLAQTGGVWDLEDVEEELFSVGRSLREYEEELSPAQADSFLDQDHGGLGAIRRHYYALKAARQNILAIDDKWRAAGGAGSATAGIP
jgi:NADH ubiquinone oxidoreductase subunit NDUFA12